MSHHHIAPKSPSNTVTNKDYVTVQAIASEGTALTMTKQRLRGIGEGSLAVQTTVGGKDPARWEGAEKLRVRP
jgi:hypothetical protein